MNFDYQAYGLTIRSDVRLSLPGAAFGEPDVSFRVLQPGEWSAQDVPADPAGQPRVFCAFRYHGSYVLRWRDFFDFSVSIDGRTIVCRLRSDTGRDYIRLALFGRILSLALHLQSVSNLHGSAVANRGSASGFIATQGGGKSTLAAFCGLSGYPVLSEEVLALRAVGNRVYVSPGYPQVRLTNESLDGLTRETGQELRTEPDYDKVRVKLDDGLFHESALPLESLYLLAPYDPSVGLDIWTTDVSYQDALPELVKSTLNMNNIDQEVVIRHVAFLGKLFERIQVKRLHFPRGFSYLHAVRDVALGYPVAAGVA